MAMEVKCPYCDKIAYTSSPEENLICPYCGKEHESPKEENYNWFRNGFVITPDKKSENKSNAVCKNFQSDGQYNCCIRIEKRPHGLLARQELAILAGEEKKFCLKDYHKCPRYRRENPEEVALIEKEKQNKKTFSSVLKKR